MAAIGGSAFAERQAERAIENKVKRDMKGGLNELGVGRMLGLKDDNGGINWHDYNYPPFLELMHYDKEELPTSVENITKFQKLFFEIVVCAGVLNLMDNFILVVAEQDESTVPAVRILFSLLNLIIFPPGALFIFHQGYKGLAISSASLLTQYKVLQAIGCFVTFCFMLFPWGAINGVGTFWTPQYQASKVKTFWSLAIIAESLIYCINLINGMSCLVMVNNFNPYATQSNSGGGNAI